MEALHMSGALAHTLASGLKPLIRKDGTLDLVDTRTHNVMEHAVEAVRILACMPEQLASATGPSGRGIYVPFGAIAPIYCFWRRAGLEECIVSVLGPEVWDSKAEFAPYDLESRDINPVRSIDVPGSIDNS